MAHITRGLSKSPVALSFIWQGQVAPYTQVYPSQVYRRGEEGRKEEVSRVLASVRGGWANGEPIRHAMMHFQKIGAAVRAIDDWHKNPHYGAIPVEAYAGVQETGTALRHRNKEAPSFYDLSAKPEAMLKALHKGEITDDLHYFMACLVRGAPYNSSKEA